MTGQSPANTANAVATGPAVEHGGRLATARTLFPGAPEPFIDLSTGINPVPYPIGPLPADAFTRLPDPSAIGVLEAAAAQAYGVSDPAMVVAAPGTQVLISMLPFVVRRPEVAVLGPTYAEHAAAWRAAGSVVREVEAVTALDGAGCAVVCNPNNPDGRRVAPAALQMLAGQCGLLVVDEAFADFEAGISVAPLLPIPRVVVLRSFGKAYGLAGLRLGFALAEPEMAAQLRAALGPWAVSGPAVAVGRSALLDRGWAERAAARLGDDARQLDAVLAPVLPVRGGTRLYRLAEGPAAAALFQRLGRAGIFVRRFGERPEWLRFGMPGTQSAWERLEAALGV